MCKCTESLYKLYQNVDMTDKDQMPKIANLPKTVYYLLG